ncbi:MAG: hypothetical protein WC307_00055 [Candidatus Nanoarchaeia archaeon]|jgi:hypothetical protein
MVRAIIDTKLGVLVVLSAFGKQKLFDLPGGDGGRYDKPVKVASLGVREALGLKTIDGVLIGDDACLLKVKGYIELGNYNSFVTNNYAIKFGSFFDLGLIKSDGGGVIDNYPKDSDYQKIYPYLEVYVDWCKAHDWRKYFSGGHLSDNSFVLPD